MRDTRVMRPCPTRKAHRPPHLGAAAVLLALLCLSTLHAQQYPLPQPKLPPAPTGSVIGHVDYATTQLPARFAEIRLVPKPTDADLAPIHPQPLKPGDPPHRDTPRLTLVTGTSGMDGNFRLEGVPPGDYLAAATKPGYILPGISMVTVALASDDQLKAIAASLPLVHVVVGQASVVNLTLHAGAAISGRILYADGSPAIATPAQAVPSEDILLHHPELRSKATTPFQGALASLYSTSSSTKDETTDDEGHYRIFGLQPGKYILGTVIALDQGPARLAMTDGSDPNSSRRGYMGGLDMIPVFAPGTFRRNDAKVFEIRGDEQITAPDLIIDSSGLHTLKGKVLAGEDRHVPNGAFLMLGDPAVKDWRRFVTIGEDGGFQLNALPSGTYTLTIHANDLNDPNVEGPMVARSYKTTTLTVIIAEHDVTLDEVMLTPLKPGEKDEDIPF